MALRFRKSLNFGPIRVNFSKKGVGASIGVRGFRTGIKADGTRYTETSIPGTGISSRSDQKPGPASRDDSPGLGFFQFFMIILGVGFGIALLVR